MGNVAVVYGDSLRSGTFMPQQMRINTDDLSAEDQALLAPREFPKGVTRNFSDEAELAKAMEGYGSTATEPPSTSEGRTIQAVIKEKGVTSCGWTPTNGKVTPFKLKPEEVEARGY